MPFVEDKRVSELLRRKESYLSSANKYFSEAKMDEEFYNGNQWTQAEKTALEEMSQYPIVVNVISPTVDQGVAMLTSNKPKFASTGREDSDTKTGRLFSDLMAYVWDKSDGNRQLKIAIKDYYVRGLGYLFAYVDPYDDFGKGEVKIRALDTFEVLVDPNSKQMDFSDAASIIIRRKMTGQEIKHIYPDFEFDNFVVENDEAYDPSSMQYNTTNLSTQGETDYLYRKYEILDEYKKIKRSYFRVFDPKTANEQVLNSEKYQEYLDNKTFVVVTQGETKYVHEQDKVIELSQLYEKTGGVFHQEMDPQTGAGKTVPGPANENSIPDTEVQLVPATIADFIAEGVLRESRVPIDRIKRTMVIGQKFYYSGIVEIDRYPIVPLVNRHHRTPYPDGDVRLSKDLQRYINKIRSLIVAHASSSTNVKLLIPRGAIHREEIEREWARAGTGVIEFDPEIGTPIVAGPTALPNELYKNEEDAKRDIQFIFGIWNLMHGDVSQAPNTFKGTVAIDEMGQRRIKSKKDDVEYALNMLASVVVQLMQATYTYKKVVRLLKPNNEPVELVINRTIYDDVTKRAIGKVNDITVGKYDIIVVSGSTLPSNRWGRFEYYMQLFQAGIIDQVEVLKQTEVADMEGVLNRMDIINQLQQQVQQLQEQLKSVTGDKQTTDRENLHLKQRVEVEKFKTKIGKVESDVAKSGELYKARTQDNLVMQKQLVNTQGKR